MGRKESNQTNMQLKNTRFYLSYDIKITLKSHFFRYNVIILSFYVRNVVVDVKTFPENL